MVGNAFKDVDIYIGDITQGISNKIRPTMYSTRGIQAVATITELRSNTSDLVEHAKKIDHGILIQKNNEPYAVLLSYDLYDKLSNVKGEE